MENTIALTWEQINTNKVIKGLVSEGKWVKKRVHCELRNHPKSVISKNNVA